MDFALTDEQEDFVAEAVLGSVALLSGNPDLTDELSDALAQIPQLRTGRSRSKR